MSTLYEILKQARLEEGMKSHFFFAVKEIANINGKIDHCNDHSFSEFKSGFGKNGSKKCSFQKLRNRAETLAQLLTYCHFVYYSDREFRQYELKEYLFIICHYDGCVFNTKDFETYFVDNDKKYVWNYKASSPDENLIIDLMEDENVISSTIYDFTTEEDSRYFIKKYKEIANGNSVSLKKKIDTTDIVSVYNKWFSAIGKQLPKNEQTHSRDYFWADVVNGMSEYKSETSELILHLSTGDKIIYDISKRFYDMFWKNYSKIDYMDSDYNFRQVADRLLDMESRRHKGDFYTPHSHAVLGWNYIKRLANITTFDSDDIFITDNCAGSGNLINGLENENCYKRCCATTYREDDVNYCKTFGGIIAYKMDYLNDYIDENGKFTGEAIPEEMRKIMNDPTKTLILIDNPPYANASNKKNCGLEARKKTSGDSTKESVADTKIRRMMKNEGVDGHEQLYVQFLYRFVREIADQSKCKVYLGLYSPIKFLNGVKYLKFRKNVFHKKYLGGFMFENTAFHGTTSGDTYPVLFSVWDLKKDIPLSEQDIVADVYDENLSIIGSHKIIVTTNKNEMLKSTIGYKTAKQNKSDTILIPTICSGFKIGKKVKEVSSDHLFGMNVEHYPDNRNVSYNVSGMHNGHVGFSVTPKSFERACVVYAANKSYDPTWVEMNDVYRAYDNLPCELVNDCCVFTVFHEKTLSCSYKDININGVNYDVPNHLMPFSIDELRTSMNITSRTIRESLANAKDDRFFSNWKEGKDLSFEAENLFSVAKAMYEYVYYISNDLSSEFMIETWDVGFYQVLRVLRDRQDRKSKELLDAYSDAMDSLKRNIEPFVKEYGIL